MVFPSTKNFKALGLIDSLGHFVPRKGKNMNVENTTSPVGETAGVLSDVRHYIIDPTTGERFEILDASFGDGEAASEETTVYVAEDLADTRVEPTIH